MEYNQYWNEIKGPEEDAPKTEETVQNEEVISFSYGVAPEEPKEETESYIFEDDDESSEEEQVDDSKMYANSSLFDLIDELEDKEEVVEEAEKVDDSRFVNFEFAGEPAEEEEEEKDVHIFSDDLKMVFDEVDNDDETEIEIMPEPEPEPAPEPEVVIEPEVQPEPEVQQEPEVQPEPEFVAEPVVEEVPHFERPSFAEEEEEPTVETDIDKLIEEAKAQESTQKKLLDSELLPLLRDIIQFMPADCHFVDYVASLTNDDRKELVRVIEKCENAWEKDKQDKLFTIADGEISICILSDSSDPMREVQRLEAVGAQMFSYEKESWNFVKLYFVEGGKLLRADTETINKGSFNNWQWKVVQQTGFNLWKSRQ